MRIQRRILWVSWTNDLHGNLLVERLLILLLRRIEGEGSWGLNICYGHGLLRFWLMHRQGCWPVLSISWLLRKRVHRSLRKIDDRRSLWLLVHYTLFQLTGWRKAYDWLA